MKLSIFIAFLANLLMLSAKQSLADIYTYQADNLSANQSTLINQDRGLKADSFYRLDEHHKVEVDQFTAKIKTTLIERFTSASDVQENGQYSVILEPETEQLLISQAFSVSKAGKISHAARDDIKVIDSNSYNTFSSAKEVIINIPAIEEGGYTVVEYEITTEKDKLEADWLAAFYPQTYSYKKNYHFEATWSNDYRPSIFIETTTIDCNQTDLALRCSGQNIPPLKSDSQTNWRDEIEYIQLSDQSSWVEVVSKYSSIFSSALSDEKSDLLKEISLDNDLSLEEKVTYIHKFVAQKIKYLSRSEYGHAFIPHETTETLKKRQGDCKDKSALLVDLFNKIGVSAYPVLVNTYQEKLRENFAPSLLQFNHVIVCFNHPQIEKNTTRCIDATDIDTPWQYTSSWIQGRLALSLNEGKPMLLPSDQYRWVMDINTSLKFLPNGGQEETQTRIYKSHYAAWLKNYINRTEVADVNRWLIEVYQKTVSNLATPKISFKGHKEMSTDIIVTSNSFFPPFINTDDNLDYSESDAWLMSELKDSLLENKVYDQKFGGIKLHSYITIDLNGVWRPTLAPATLNLYHKYGHAERTTSIENNKINVETSINIPSRWVNVEEIKFFNEFIKSLHSQMNIKLYGKPTTH